MPPEPDSSYNPEIISTFLGCALNRTPYFDIFGHSLDATTYVKQIIQLTIRLTLMHLHTQMHLAIF